MCGRDGKCLPCHGKASHRIVCEGRAYFCQEARVYLRVHREESGRIHPKLLPAASTWGESLQGHFYPILMNWGGGIVCVL